ncbi:histidine kinase [Nocardioides sp. TRM66260-LWL]|uniref:sensor histidine kinase n=1 Tax=Nocardioides sp. TRM66260-LWL TaxID=2874478 RepID=UPI001CC6EC56|nr:histidine kinase [Nocardioides sp. TRM66260-LWL]MBZ5732949.1 histidine kinase [Nocardioides sp. TRM66260-LWL]
MTSRPRVERPDPAAIQPPLSGWRHGWRLTVCALISLGVWLPVQDSQSGRRMALDLALGLASFGLVCLRRRWPMPIALALNALTLVSATAAGPALLGAVSVATRRRYREVALVAGTAFLAGVAWSRQTSPEPTGDPWWVDALVNLVVAAAAAGWGLYLGSRRELLWTLHRRAELAEAEREQQAASARVTERARIAREMHDVLAHRISQISMHAGALAFREDLGPDALRAEAEVIAQRAQEALRDLRGVLGVLRDPETGRLVEGAATVPQPTHADVAALVAEARSEGQSVDLVDAVAAPVPDALGRTVYRLVQEGLTNARKHAPGALLTVRLEGDPDAGLSVLLRNPLGFARRPADGARLGLIGLAERAELSGGRLEHGLSDGAFEVRAWLPWPS